jgi:hypothetical protein
LEQKSRKIIEKTINLTFAKETNKVDRHIARLARKYELPTLE